MSSPAPSGKMIPREGVVTRVVRESADAVTVHLYTGQAEEHLPGQFLSIDPHQFEELDPWLRYLEALRGRRETRRCYSLSSAPGEPEIAITVKAERYDAAPDHPPPLMAPFLLHTVRPGRRVAFAGYSGRYVLGPEVAEEGRGIVHLVAGAGIVPNFSMIKHDLAQGALSHTVLYANRRLEDALFRAQLDALARRHPDRLKVIHCLSDDRAAEGDHHPGRISEACIRSHVPQPQAARYFVCGPGIKPRERRAARQEGIELPPRFMEAMLAALTALDVPGGQIVKESW